MEMKPGYKLTEVGVIPDDWKVECLGKLLTELANGAVYQPSNSFGLPVTRIETIADGTIDMSRVGYGTPTSQLEKYRMQAGDILFSHINSVDHIGKVAIYNGEPPLYHGMNLLLFRAGSSLHSKFLFYWLGSHQGRKKAVSFARQAVSQASINTSELKGVEIPLPPLPEQRAIAGALSDVDALLGALDQLIAKKRDLKQAAMQQLLTGQTRLPGFQGEWQVKRLDKLAPLQRGFDLPTSQIKKGNYPVVYSNGVQNCHEKFMVKAPGVVTGRSGTIGNVHFVEQDYWPHNTALWVTNFQDNNPKFIFYLLTSIGLERFATGSGVPTLNRNNVHEFRVSVPPAPAEQTAIAEVLTDLDAELAGLEQRRAKTRALKQGMMQELLTGRTRLV